MAIFGTRERLPTKRAAGHNHYEKPIVVDRLRATKPRSWKSYSRTNPERTDTASQDHVGYSVYIRQRHNQAGEQA